MAWNDVLQEEEFQELQYSERRNVANNYFDRRLRNAEFEVLPIEEKNRIHANFLDTIGNPEINMFESIFNGYYKTLAGFETNLRALDDPSAALDIQRQRERDFPSEGVSGFLGSTLGSITPSIATLVGSVYFPLAAPGLAKAMYTLYGASAAGSSRIKTEAFERRTGEDIGFTRDWGVALGFGVAEVAFERMGFKGVQQAWKGVGKVGWKEMGNAIKGGNVDDIVKVLNKRIVPGIVGSAAIESFQESTTELAQQMLSFTYDINAFSIKDIGRAALGGAVGGTMLSGVAAFTEAGKTPDLVIERATDENLPPGITQIIDPDITESLNFKASNLVELQGEDTSIENVRAQDAVMESIIKEWTDVNRQDTGDGLEEWLEEKGIRIKKPQQRAEHITFSTNEFKKGRAVYNTPDGRAIDINVIKPGVSKKEAERALVAFDWIARQESLLSKNVEEVNVLSGAERTWLNSLFKLYTKGKSYNSVKQSAPEKAAQFKEEFGDANSVFWFDDEIGGYRAAVRGSQKGELLGSKTSKYIYAIAHEGFHANQYKELGKEKFKELFPEGKPHKAQKGEIDAIEEASRVMLKFLKSPQSEKLEFQRKAERQFISDKAFNEKSFYDFNLEASVNISPLVSREGVDRVLTALNFVSKKAPRFSRQIDNIYISGPSLIDYASNIFEATFDRKPVSIEDRFEVASIQRNETNEGSIAMHIGNETTNNIVYRGDNPVLNMKDIISRKVEFLSGTVAHELLHAKDTRVGVLKKFMDTPVFDVPIELGGKITLTSKPLSETRADQIAKTTERRFRESPEAKDLEFQRKERIESLRAREKELLIGKEANLSGELRGVQKELAKQIELEKNNVPVFAYEQNSIVQNLNIPSPKQQVRLLNGLSHIFNRIVQSEGQLYNNRGEAINAAVNTDDKVLYLSQHIEWDTIGHEGTEMVIASLGLDSPIVQRGIEFFGNKESLSDAVGQFYRADVTEDRGVLQKLNRWLSNIWLEYANKQGLDLAEQDVLNLINNKMRYSPDLLTSGEIEFQKAKRNFRLRDPRFVGTVTPTNRVIEREEQISDLKEDINARNERLVREREEAIQSQEDRRKRAAKKERERIVAEEKFGPDYIKNINLNSFNINDFQKNFLKDNIEGKLPTVEVEDSAWANNMIIAVARNPKRMNEIFEKVRNNEGTNAIEGGAINFFASYKTIETLKQHFMENPNETWDEAQIAKADELANVWSSVSLSGADKGRGLKYLQYMAGAAELLDASTGMKRSLSPERQNAMKKAVLMGSATNPELMLELIRLSKAPQARNYVFNWWFAAILSGGANIKNVFVNTIEYGLQYPHKFTEAGYDKFMNSSFMRMAFPTLARHERERFFSEIGAFWRQSKESFPKALKSIKDVYVTGKVPAGIHNKWDADLGGARDAFLNSPNERLQKIGKLISPPLKALIAVDIGFRTLAADAEMAALIERQRQLGKSMSRGEMIDRATKFANRATFVDEPGAFIDLANKIRNFPGTMDAGTFVIPFVRTFANEIKRGAEMVPGVGLVTSKGDLAKGNIDSTTIVARQIEGILLTGMLLTWFWDEDRLTGDVPRDPGRRDAYYRPGKKPWSFRVGDSYVSYRHLGPVGIAIGAIVSLRDAIKDGMDDEVTLEEMFANVGYAVARNLLSSTWIENISRITEGPDKLSRFVRRLPASFVPYSGFLRLINKSIESMQSKPFNTDPIKLREMNTFTAELANVLPWTPNTPTRLNAFGEDIELNSGGFLRQWSPIPWSDVKEDPIELGLEEVGIYPKLPGRTLKVAGRTLEMDDDFYRKYAIIYGRETKKAIGVVMRDPRYESLSLDAKHKVLERAIGRARLPVQQLARRALLLQALQ